MQRASGLARLLTRFVPGFTDVPACTGCGRRYADDVQLISGPEVYLCGQCIADAAQRLAPRKLVIDGVRCRFCGNVRATTDVTRAGDVAVCADCLGRMESILEQDIGRPQSTSPSR